VRILIVDDDLASLKVMTSLLEKKEYEVMSATKVSDAIRQLEKWAMDLVIADIAMDEGTGLQLLHYLRLHPRYSRVPVLACSTRSDIETVQEAHKLGAVDFIVKPIDENSMLAKVAEAIEHATITVLLVDNDNLILDILSRIVKRGGFRPLTAQSGSEALELLEKVKVQAVVSDINMPDMDGLQLLKKIKELYPHLPVIMITGRPGVYDRRDVMAAGADGYIIKPFKNTDVLQRLAAVT